MIKCLISDNNTVEETHIPESVLEEEYLQEEVVLPFTSNTSKV